MNRHVAAAAIVALVLRLGFALFYWVDKPMTHDEREYLALASSLASGNGFRYPAEHDAGSGPRFGRAPGYPAFLAMIGSGRMASASPARVKVAQSIIGALTVVLIAAIAMRAAGPRAAAAAAWIAALYPPLVWTPAYVFSETLYSGVALLAAFLLQRSSDTDATEPPRARIKALAAGLLAGCAVLVRPVMLVFVPLAALWMLRRRRVMLMILFVGATVAVVAPWTARNIREYGRVIVVASEGGVTFWTGNHPLARGEGDLAANPHLKREEVAFRQSYPGLTAEQLEPLYYRAALSYMAEHPIWWMTLVARKAFYTIVPIGPSYRLHSKKYLIASVVPYLLVLPFAIAGLWRMRNSATRPTSVLLLACSSILVCLIFFPQERFRIPVVDPVLIICAATLAGRPSIA